MKTNYADFRYSNFVLAGLLQAFEKATLFEIWCLGFFGQQHFRQPKAPEYMSNALSPDHMTSDERIAELASIISVGLIRLKARKSSGLSGHQGESCLDFTGSQSGHEPVETKTEKTS